MIDESIFFSSDVVSGNVPLKVGQKVNVVVEDDKPLYGFRAIKVDVVPHPLNGNGPSDSKLRVLNGCVASISEDTIYISNIIYFPMDIFSEDFVPYKGDLLEVEYSTEPGISNIKATSVKPTRCIHVEEVISFRFLPSSVSDNPSFGENLRDQDSVGRNGNNRKYEEIHSLPTKEPLFLLKRQDLPKEIIRKLRRTST
uniref:Uncharacterized protein n=1 Tax=Papio anubis TaxID=9555 RepID=A0A8I5R8J5_PAPAN